MQTIGVDGATSAVSIRNVKNEEQARASNGRLFHARAADIGKGQSPRVARRYNTIRFCVFNVQ